MNWSLKAFVLVVLNLWLFTPVVALLLVGAHFAPHPALWSAIALVPTLLLSIAILQSILTKHRELPAWAWMLDTLDSPTSPYSDFEPTAKSYYRFGRFFGDYLWFAWRNQWYGLGFHWGAVLDPATQKITLDGNPRVGATANYDGTGAFVYGTYRSSVVDAAGNPVCWEYKKVAKLGPIMFKVWGGWKDVNDCFHYPKDQWMAMGIAPAAMLAVQFYFRKAK